MSNETTTQISIIELLSMLKKRLVAIILVAIFCGVGAFLFSYFLVNPTYATSATVLVKSTNISSEESSSSVLTDLNASQKLTASYMIVLKSEVAMENILEKTNLNYETSELKEMISISVVNDSEILKLTVTGKEPDEIVSIANALLEVAPNLLQKIVETGSVNTVDVAKYYEKVSPSIPKNVLIFAFIGALITSFIVIILGLLDQTIKDEDEISAMYNINVLGSVPSFENIKNGGNKNA